MNYYEIGEAKGAAAAKSEAIAPVPSAPTSPTIKPEGERGPVMSFMHKQIVGPVKVWHVGAGAGAGILGYMAYRMFFRSRY